MPVRRFISRYANFALPMGIFWILSGSFNNLRISVVIFFMSWKSRTPMDGREEASTAISFRPLMKFILKHSFFLARHMSLPLFQEYVQSEVHKQNHLPSDTVNQTAKPSHELQRESAYTILSLQIAEGLPAVVTVIILGAVSDRTGRRKILLWLPSLGSCIYSLIFILVQYTGWSLDGLFMASAIRGLSGSMTAFLAGSSYYAINSVKPNQRSSRLALQELLNGAAYAIGNVMVGYWVRDAGYLQPFWFTFILSLITFLVAFFLVQEVRVDNNNHSERYLNTGNCCVDTFKPLGRLFKCCNNRDLIRIWLAILAFQTYAIVHLGQINVLVLYFLGPPMSWPSVKIGIFLSVLMAIAAIGTGMVPPFLRNYVTDTNITFAGYLSKAIGTLWIAVIQNDTVIYFAMLLLVLELLPFPMLRSIVSKGVEPSEQGSLFSLMHCGESISYFLAPLLFQSIYGSTLHFYSGFIFVISVMLLVLPVTFTIGIRYIEINYPTEYQEMDGETEMIVADAASIAGREEDQGLGQEQHQAQTEYQGDREPSQISIIQVNKSV